MKRTFLSVSAAVIIGLSSMWPAGSIDVSANASLQNKMNDIQGKRESISNNINANLQEIERLQAEQKKIEEEVKQLDAAVAETNEKIRTKQSEITAANEAIKKLEQEIAVVTERIKKRNELLKQRARSLQESGGTINYIEVLLGSQSFGDLISRVGAVSTIVQADKEILREHEEDKRLKQEKETAHHNELASLQKKLKELEGLKQKLQQQAQQKTQLMAKLEKEEDHKEGEIHKFESEDKILAQQANAVKEQIAEWKRRQLELEEARKREAAAAKSSGRSYSAPSAGSLPSVTGGMFMRPANGPMTSPFGPRDGKLHAGVDIGKRGSDVPIVAAADGKVFRSYYSSSYGNVVFISHYINGEVWTTVYAHMENRAVSEGQTVEKGQFLGYMGNTGRSFGAHLHFELHRGPWTSSKSNSVDPRPFIN